MVSSTRKPSHFQPVGGSTIVTSTVTSPNECTIFILVGHSSHHGSSGIAKKAVHRNKLKTAREAAAAAAAHTAAWKKLGALRKENRDLISAYKIYLSDSDSDANSRDRIAATLLNPFRYRVCSSEDGVEIRCCGVLM